MVVVPVTPFLPPWITGVFGENREYSYWIRSPKANERRTEIHVTWSLIEQFDVSFIDGIKSKGLLG